MTRSAFCVGWDLVQTWSNDRVIVRIGEDRLKKIEGDLIVVEDQDNCHSSPSYRMT